MQLTKKTIKKKLPIIIILSLIVSIFILYSANNNPTYNGKSILSKNTEEGLIILGGIDSEQTVEPSKVYLVQNDIAEQLYDEFCIKYDYFASNTKYGLYHDELGSFYSFTLIPPKTTEDQIINDMYSNWDNLTQSLISFSKYGTETLSEKGFDAYISVYIDSNPHNDYVFEFFRINVGQDWSAADHHLDFMGPYYWTPYSERYGEEQ